MAKPNDVFINDKDVEEIRERIPKDDFINKEFDKEKQSGLTDILFILSTPRSGSTYFSNLIYKNEVCIPHEYFQPFEYIPLMADRWGCNRNGLLDKEKYLKNLIKYRTYNNGWLGINLHGEHLKIFSKFETLLPKTNMHFIHMVRRNDLSQAVSFEIAYQTKKWSSQFGSFGNANYTFSGVKQKLDSIYKQNSLIKSYLNSRQVEYQTICYEDLVSSPEATLKNLLPDMLRGPVIADSDLQRQSSKINKEWLQQFSTEYFETEGNGYEPPGFFGAKNKARRIIKSIIKNK